MFLTHPSPITKGMRQRCQVPQHTEQNSKTGSSVIVSCTKMGNNKAGIFCSFLMLVSIQTEIFAADIYSNIWAVKVRGSVQEARQLAAKHGFIYGRHVSVDVFSLFMINLSRLLQYRVRFQTVLNH